uniref:Peptidase M16 N-terminal domain-containing protein n=1 Tax=Ditylum brightwellii TaxID=49249 RepID=A0A7S4QE70_9STRA
MGEPTTTNAKITKPLSLPIKGKSDWRDYRPLLLPNGATLMLVRDSQSKTTAMSVCVNVGASSDPRALSGLAHFCEHMCFLGSEAYPGENTYKKYLSAHGGKSNAATSMSYTTYKFDVLAEHCEQAVDIFAGFFVQPLFTPSGTSREVNAVDSENSKNLTTDIRRRLQILKALADPNHHFSKFSTGNAITLPASSSTSTDEEKEEEDSANYVREALLAFHARHYRPENMVIVIVGPQSLDTLEEWVVPRFAPMIDRWSLKQKDTTSFTEIEQLINDAATDAPETRYDKPLPPYHPAFQPKIQGGSWPVLLTTLPLRSMRKLVLLFPLPSVRKVPDRSPVSILSHLLGHEGPGSSFAALQDAGYLSSLSTGSRIAAPDQTLLQIDVSLTEDGETHWTKVVETLFQHCRLLYQTALTARDGKDETERSAALNDLQRMWGEISSLNSMNFHQTSPSAAYSFAPALAQRIVGYGTEQCISAGTLLNESAETLPLDELIEFSSRLIPSNCIVERCSKGAWEEQMNKTSEEDSSSSSIFGVKREKWYDIEYHLSKIDPVLVRTWEGGDINGNKTVQESSSTIEGESSLSLIGPLHLPRPNRYIPRTLELCPDLPDEAKLGPRIEKEIDPPNLIVNQPGTGRLWHRLDDRYALPKSSLSILLRSATVENVKGEIDNTWAYNVDTAMQSQILTGVFSDALAQETYDASLAGLHWSLYKSSAGIVLNCSGYSDRLPDLAIQLLKDFFMVGEENKDNDKESFLQESHFTSTKDRAIRGYKSFFQSRRADTQAMYFRDLLMSSLGGGNEKSLVAAESITLESLKQQHKRILMDADKELECLFFG